MNLSTHSHNRLEPFERSFQPLSAYLFALNNHNRFSVVSRKELHVLAILIEKVDTLVKKIHQNVRCLQRCKKHFYEFSPIETLSYFDINCIIDYILRRESESTNQILESTAIMRSGIELTFKALSPKSLDALKFPNATAHLALQVLEGPLCFLSEDKLGKGGFGNIHIVVLSNGSKYARKTLHDAFHYPEMLLEGAIKAHRAQSRYLMGISHADETNLWMDKESSSLQDAIENPHNSHLIHQHMPSITRQLIEAIGYLHHVARIAHRDIKPANILINKTTKQIKFIDFEMMGFLDSVKHRCGSPYFFSPRLAGSSGEITVDAADDLWALGISIFRLLTRRDWILDLPKSTTVPELYSFIDDLSQEQIDEAIDQISLNIELIRNLGHKKFTEHMVQYGFHSAQESLIQIGKELVKENGGLSHYPYSNQQLLKIGIDDLLHTNPRCSLDSLASTRGQYMYVRDHSIEELDQLKVDYGRIELSLLQTILKSLLKKDPSTRSSAEDILITSYSKQDARIDPVSTLLEIPILSPRLT
jgi:serine/threonine protein kinase